MVKNLKEHWFYLRLIIYIAVFGMTINSFIFRELIEEYLPFENQCYVGFLSSASVRRLGAESVSDFRINYIKCTDFSGLMKTISFSNGKETDIKIEDGGHWVILFMIIVYLAFFVEIIKGVRAKLMK